MNILITGGKGLVGSHFVDVVNKTHHTIFTPSIEELDISDYQAVDHYFVTHDIDIVVHFAAFTDVTKSEEERGDKNGLTWKVNVSGTENLVHTAKNAHFIFISTDMVFSGSAEDKGPYHENHGTAHNPNLVPWYGWTKCEAERIVSSYNTYAIVRISNPVRNGQQQKPDYIKKIISAYEKNHHLSLFNDQYLTLSYIPTISKSLKKIIDNKMTGIFHVSSPDIFTPYELGQYILEKKYSTEHAVASSSLTDFVQKTGQTARYPQYGGLQVTDSMNRLGLIFPTWREAVDEVI